MPMSSPAAPAVVIASKPFDRTIGIAFIAFVILGLPEGLLGLAWPSIRAEFGLTQDAIGGFLLAGTLGFLLTSFNSGYLLDRLGAGRTVMLAALLRGGAFLAIMAAPSWTAIIACNFVAGLGTGMLDAGVNTYLSGYRSTRLLNWLHACFGVGATLGPLLMDRLFSLGLSWQWGYVTVGTAQISIALLVLATLARWRIEPPPQQPGDSPTGGRSLSPLTTLRLPVVWLSIALFAVYAGIEVGAGQWSYTLFTEGRGIGDD
ncbi:MFS transporter, partial [bacterium]|nr:MFS transporter [bacterium]